MTARLSETEYTYDGTAKKPIVTVIDESGHTLLENIDFMCQYVDNIDAGTTIKILKEKTKTNGIIKIYDRDGKEVKDENDTIKTGMKVVIEKENTYEKEEFKIAVKGDVSGDGKVTVLDL